VPPGLPEVPHDPEPLQQVLINLFKNAAEASASGAHVRVEAVVGKGTVTVRVRDEGCGMDAETQRTLFEPFFTTKPKGTGLGLYVSQDIVRRHGGSLTVSSEPGRGTTFTLELPCEPQGGTR
jgi:signal transduction histidine kinase